LISVSPAVLGFHRRFLFLSLLSLLTGNGAEKHPPPCILHAFQLRRFLHRPVLTADSVLISISFRGVRFSALFPRPNGTVYAAFSVQIVVIVVIVIQPGEILFRPGAAAQRPAVHQLLNVVQTAGDAAVPVYVKGVEAQTGRSVCFGRIFVVVRRGVCRPALLLLCSLLYVGIRDFFSDSEKKQS